MSGYDLSFVREVPAEYLCPICDCPMRDPVQTKCGHRFCKVCLEKSFTRKRKLCPLDRSHLNPRSRTDIYPDLAISRTILNFIVRCPHHSNGCDWTGELRIVETHEAGCSFIGVKCLNMHCTEAPLKKDLQKHMTQECPKREVICEYCETRFIFFKRQDHFDECTKYPMSCPQKCGEEEIPRDKMNVHLKEFCSHTMGDCTYAYVGCALKVQRGALEQHVKENTEAHLALACKRLQEFQVLLAVNFNNIKEIQASIGNTDPDISLASEIKDLSGSIRLSNRFVQQLRSKVFELENTINDLPGEELALQSEVDTLDEEFQELKLDVQNDKNRLQHSMSYGFQGVRREIALIKKSQESRDTDYVQNYLTLQGLSADGEKQWDEIRSIKEIIEKETIGLGLVIFVVVCSIVCYHFFFASRAS
ncbi:TNF receptor-associated factor 6-like isoform X1 [Montipora foliosa]|uniref:TNF receptor-associated factor 6-like isoform X1 n=1 Tax=Montipora foliosa TaxID=591990 RepID=UPI0035F1527A